MNTSKLILAVTIIAIVASTGIFYKFYANKNDAASQFVLKPTPPIQTRHRRETVANCEVGVGWAVGDARHAVQAALAMALKDKTYTQPDLVILYPTAGSDCPMILKEIKRATGARTKIFGGTSDACGTIAGTAYVTPPSTSDHDDLKDVRNADHGLSLMTITSPLIGFGVGGAIPSDHPSKTDMALSALRRAMDNAGKTPAERPSAILISPSLGMEQAGLDALAQSGLGDIPLLGGTAAGPNGYTLYHQSAEEKGISFALIYTELPLGWAFESGYDVLDKHSGIVTKTNGTRILEIDNQPAFEVYDDWMNGRVSALLKKKSQQHQFRKFLSLNPLARVRETPDGKTYTLLSHPWVTSKNLITQGLNTTTDIQVGDRVFLSYGTWEILLNRIANIPKKAVIKGDITENTTILLGLGYICTDVLSTIPEENKKTIPGLISHSISGAPFIASIPWGEQGQFSGIGNKQCNLTVGFLVIGDKIE